ncbi:capsular polysaccharide synthesis protein [Streptococcus thermophilus]|nr:capsular biosynthesis protein [Streptococcus thermophilus]
MKLEQLKKLSSRGELFPKILSKLHDLFPVYYITNKNLRSQQRISKNYQKLYRQYRAIIENGVAENLVSTKSNIVWTCWFQGEQSAPDLVRACINSIRKNMPNHRVIIITNENIRDYTDFPEYIWNKFESGNISFAHFSDLLRVELLCNHGGIWMDSTILCTQQVDFEQFIEGRPLFLFKQLDLIRKDEQEIISSSWLISSDSNNKILLLTRLLLWEYWKENNYLIDYFTFHLFLTMSARRYVKEWSEIPLYNNHTPHVMFFELEKQFDEKRWKILSSQSPFHKLNHHLDYNNLSDQSLYHHILKEYLKN